MKKQGDNRMTTYFLDIETRAKEEGIVDPETDEIVSIQYVPFYEDSGKPIDNLKILGTWDSSERQALSSFLDVTGWLDANPDPWKFIPASTNLDYDMLVIWYRTKKVLHKEIPLKFLISSLPKIDLKGMMIVLNNGQFKGSGFMELFAGVNGYNQALLQLRKAKDWEQVTKMYSGEATLFLTMYKELVTKMPAWFDKNIRIKKDKAKK